MKRVVQFNLLQPSAVGMVLHSAAAPLTAGMMVRVIYTSFCELSRWGEPIKEQVTEWTASADRVPKSAERKLKASGKKQTSAIH